jgi:hypothetical protein
MFNQTSAVPAVLILTLIGMYFPARATVIEIPTDYPTIQMGVDSSSDGDTVLVQPNRYVENINFNGHQIVLGSLFLTTGDTSYITSTVLDGDTANSVIINNNWYDSLSQITGFTIINGNAFYGGGGIVFHGSGTISHNIIRDNRASRGGGIYIDGNSLIEDNLITENQVTVAGGGIISYGGACVIRNNQIINNVSTHYGGGIHLEDSQIITVENNIIAHNHAEHIGGGLLFYADVAGGIVTNNLIIDNSSEIYSALGMYIGYYVITNNTIADNSRNPSGIRLYEYGEFTLINNIIWNNADSELVIEPNASVAITYNDVQGGIDGEGNINSYPLFCEPESDDYQLAANSPCAGTGFEGADIGALGIGCEASGIFDSDDALPEAFRLDQNYPNPFNGSTEISFTLNEPQSVNLSIYDLLGRKTQTLVDNYLPAGTNRIVFDASVYPSGVFFYRLEAGGISQSRRMVLIK